MLEQTAVVLQRPWAKGALLVFAVCVQILCALCHAESAHASTSQSHGANVVAAGDDGSTPAPEHEHRESHQCDDSGVGADHRVTSSALLMLTAVAMALAVTLWVAAPKARTWSSFLQPLLPYRGGTPLLISLCISRV